MLNNFFIYFINFLYLIYYIFYVESTLKKIILDQILN